ncbi:MAG: hypothetical protein NTY30_02930 [Candidatus Berkelbacteria bacterium]|nr:hypothetical protein [Candidatus Berkelbacteria bacterium]
MPTLELDGTIPQYPEIRDDGVTPAGFGNVDGDKPCFCATYNRVSLYIPHLLTDNPEVAKQIFEAAVPMLENFWTAPGNFSFVVTIDGKQRCFDGKHAFSHVLISEYTS